MQIKTCWGENPHKDTQRSLRRPQLLRWSSPKPHRAAASHRQPAHPRPPPTPRRSGKETPGPAPRDGTAPGPTSGTAPPALRGKGRPHHVTREQAQRWWRHKASPPAPNVRLRREAPFAWQDWGRGEGRGHRASRDGPCPAEAVPLGLRALPQGGRLPRARRAPVSVPETDLPNRASRSEESRVGGGTAQMPQRTGLKWLTWILQVLFKKYTDFPRSLNSRVACSYSVSEFNEADSKRPSIIYKKCYEK